MPEISRFFVYIYNLMTWTFLDLLKIWKLLNFCPFPMLDIDTDSKIYILVLQITIIVIID